MRVSEIPGQDFGKSRTRISVSPEANGDFAPAAHCQPAKSAQFLTGQWMGRRTAVLESTDVQERVFEVDFGQPNF